MNDQSEPTTKRTAFPVTNENVDLSGQIALVTGASRGIGRVVALTLAQSGARVAVVARTQTQRDDLPGTVGDTVRQINDSGGEAIAVHADLAEPGAPRRVYEEVAATFGPLDILVNNASNTGAPVFESIDSETPEGWRRSMELNVNVPWELMKLAVPAMRARGRGVIINMVSSAGLLPAAPPPRLGEPGGLGAIYGCTKAALIQMSIYLASELGPDGIAVIAMEPGYTRTEATELHAASFGIDLSMAHPMELVGEAAAAVAGASDPLVYAGRFLYATEVVGYVDVAGAPGARPSAAG